MLSPFMMPSSQKLSPHRQQSPRMTPIRTVSSVVDGFRALRPDSPAQLSPIERGPRNKRRVRHESLGGSGSLYRTAAKIPSRRLGHSPQISVPSISVSQPSSEGSSRERISSFLRTIPRYDEHNIYWFCFSAHSLTLEDFTSVFATREREKLCICTDNQQCNGCNNKTGTTRFIVASVVDLGPH